MLLLALRTLRYRAGGFVASFVALFFGTVLVMACGGLMETGIRTAVPPQRLVAADVVVTGDQSHPEPIRLDATLVTRIRSVPGVADAVPDVSFPAALLRDGMPVTDGDQQIGHAWASAALGRYGIRDGAAPAEHEIAVDTATATRAGVGVGDQVDVVVRGTPARFRVSGVVSADQIIAGALFFAEPDVARIVPAGDQVDAIGVLAAPGFQSGQLRDALATALKDTPTTLLTGDERGLAEFASAADGGETMIVLAGVFGGLAVLVAIFVVASILGLSVQQRQQEMALLRAIGGTPGQLRRLLLGETMMIGLLAAAAAYPFGRPVGRFLFDQLADGGVAPPAIVFHQGFVPTLVGSAVTMLTALLAAWAAGWAAARTRPTEALVEAGLQRRWVSWPRILFAVLFLAGGMALTLVTALVMKGPVAASTAGPTAMLWATGFALLGPGLTRVIVLVLYVPLRAMCGLSGHLALLNARTRRIRTAGMIMPIMLATGLATSLLYLQTSQSEAADRAYTENLRADAALVSTAGGFPVNLVRSVRTLPGVGQASAVVNSEGYLESEEVAETGYRETVPLQGITADGADRTAPVALTAGTLADLRGDTVALATTSARHFGYELGDTVPLWLGDNTRVSAKVVALFAARHGFETMLAPAELVAPHTRTGLAQEILVRAAPGVAPGTLIATLADFAADHPGLRVAGQDTLRSAHAEQEQTGVWINYLLAFMIICYTVISLVNTLIVATAERRREFAVQRLIGTTRGQVLGMMSAEAVLVVVGGIILGTLVSITTLVPFNLALSDSPLPHGPLWIYLAVTGSAAALTLLATLLPTLYALRTPPVAASTTP
ncbi:FtsX-like permease family protein [Protofrankia coriariae]|uniref:ABC transporter permease n=1 Tax=Protofrankia coriariae TaxID=1562887 RepID=A0ABR5F654_9ACTN|nr:ABC transporter permease [Protofrankia coriariae]KLL12205.1 ABC transporter permease [Protofrankia coriariae]